MQEKTYWIGKSKTQNQENKINNQEEEVETFKIMEQEAEIKNKNSQ